MQLLEIWRYPVKSMGGERLAAADVTDLGIEGDRRWGVFDADTGTVLTARRAPDLLFASARVVDGDLIITLPDGSEVDEATASDALSRWLERRVELRRAGDEGGTYENPMDPVNETDWVSWTGPGGAWHDSPRGRVSLVSTSTLGDWDLRRFRTNLLVDGAGEDRLVGQQVTIGEVRLDVNKRLERCVMVTRPQPGLDRDLALLTTINRERGRCLSIGTTVAVPGAIQVGASLIAPG